jgi:hypothetical protein
MRRKKLDQQIFYFVLSASFLPTKILVVFGTALGVKLGIPSPESFYGTVGL